MNFPRNSLLWTCQIDAGSFFSCRANLRNLKWCNLFLGVPFSTFSSILICTIMSRWEFLFFSWGVPKSGISRGGIVRFYPSEMTQNRNQPKTATTIRIYLFCFQVEKMVWKRGFNFVSWIRRKSRERNWTTRKIRLLKYFPYFTISTWTLW